jgi:hypothetical protein
MFTLDATIDAVQNGKKQFVKTFVQNEKMADAMNTFIDEQASYTKKAAKIGSETMSTLVAETTKTMQDAMKFDYTKFGEGIMKAYQTTQSKAK